MPLMLPITTRHLTIGADRLCTACAGAGAIVHATADKPARPATRGELSAFHSNRPGPARSCGRCQGIGIEPGSRVLREGDHPAELDAAAWPSEPRP